MDEYDFEQWFKPKEKSCFLTGGGADGQLGRDTAGSVARGKQRALTVSG